MKRCKYSFLNSCPQKMKMARNRFQMVNPDISMLMAAALLWEGQNKWTDVTPGTTVRYHVVNLGAFGFFHFWIEEHELTVIEVDGVDVEPYKTSGINVAVGQRYSILVTMKDNDSCNYAMVGSMGLPFKISS